MFISGIGCSSRFPYYMNTFGFHTIHGRAPAIATGVKIARPDLDVWVVTGDGDSLSIGGNHTIHMLRRNVGLKVLLFNNRIYGLTKGQYSPTSEIGKKTKSTPFGTADRPFNPISLAIGAEATFRRALGGRFPAAFERNAEESGGSTRARRTLRSCKTATSLTTDAWEDLTEKDARSEHIVQLEHGKPLIFGKNRDKGIRLNGLDLEVVQLGNGITEKDLLVHDEHIRARPMRSCWRTWSSGPVSPPRLACCARGATCRATKTLIATQIREVQAKRGKGDLAEASARGRHLGSSSL